MAWFKIPVLENKLLFMSACLLYRRLNLNFKRNNLNVLVTV